MDGLLYFMVMNPSWPRVITESSNEPLNNSGNINSGYWGVICEPNPVLGQSCGCAPESFDDNNCGLGWLGGEQMIHARNPRCSIVPNDIPANEMCLGELGEEGVQLATTSGLSEDVKSMFTK